MKFLIFLFAAVCAGFFIDTKVSISGDVVSDLMKLKEIELTFLNATTLLASVVLFGGSSI
jgi:hypothetical protein